MRNTAKRFVGTVATIGSFIVGSSALAQSTLRQNITGGAEAVNQNIGLTTQDLPTTIGKLIQAAMGLIGILLVVYFIYAGYLWMTSQGDSKQTQKAKDIMMTATIGLAILLAAYAITSFVLNAVLTGVGV